MVKVFKSKEEAFIFARHEAFENLCFMEEGDHCTKFGKLEVKIKYFKTRDEWEVEVPFKSY